MIKKFLTNIALKTVYKRKPDFIVGGEQNPYMLRWWLIPRNRILNIYIHMFLKSDDDRALHDHPWASLSLLCRGTLKEVTKTPELGEDQFLVDTIKAGDWSYRPAAYAHRIIVQPQKETPITVFITGPRFREWGFYCPKGWKHWKDFVGINKGTIGAGCGEDDL